MEKIFSKTKSEERTWAKLVNLNIVHWYCDGPEPTAAAIKYEERTRQRKSVISFFLRSFALNFTRLPLFLQRWTTRRGGLPSEAKLLEQGDGRGGDRDGLEQTPGEETDA